MEAFSSWHGGSSPHSVGTIHASICALVVAQAEAGDAAWAAYAQIFLSPAIQDAVSALLEPAAEEDEAAPNKKRKATELPAAQEQDAEISLSIASMDGTSVPLRLPKRSRIGLVKQAVGTVRSVFAPNLLSL
jgi:hypothetical protein